MPLKIPGAAEVLVTSFDVSKAHLESLKLEEAILTQLAALIFYTIQGWPWAGQLTAPPPGFVTLCHAND